VRAHLRDAPLLTAALEALARVREVALLSAPAGVPRGGEEAQVHWRQLLAAAEESGELRIAGLFLQKALETTRAADQRISGFKIAPSELVGEGVWLTPRMREATEESARHADKLAADVVAAAWHKGDPDRLKRRNPLQEEPASRRRADSHASVGRHVSQEPRVMESVTGSPASSRQESKTAFPGLFSGKDLHPDPTAAAPNWTRALGYYEHDDADFDRVWRAPLMDALTRSFSCPQVRRHRSRSSNVPQADALDQFVQLHLVQSTPGKLRARCVVQPKHKIHQKVSEQRLRELAEAPVAASLVSSAVAKDLRKGGYMLPKYGLQLTVRKGKKSSLAPGAEKEGSAELAAEA